MDILCLKYINNQGNKEIYVPTKSFKFNVKDGFFKSDTSPKKEFLFIFLDTSLISLMKKYLRKKEKTTEKEIKLIEDLFTEING